MKTALLWALFVSSYQVPPHAAAWFETESECVRVATALQKRMDSSSGLVVARGWVDRGGAYCVQAVYVTGVK